MGFITLGRRDQWCWRNYPRAPVGEIDAARGSGRGRQHCLLGGGKEGERETGMRRMETAHPCHPPPACAFSLLPQWHPSPPPTPSLALTMPTLLILLPLLALSHLVYLNW